MFDEQGLTLIELIIVLAIIAIIGAILIPNFLNTTEKARLKGDVQSAKIISNAIELYKAEQAGSLSSESISSILSELSGMKYIEATQADIQTENAEWGYEAGSGTVVVYIGMCSENIRNNVVNQLTEQERRYVKNASSSD